MTEATQDSQATEDQVAEDFAEVPTIAPVRGHRVTQADWDARRKESKARAAKTIKANAKKAEAAKKKALPKGALFDTGDLAEKAAVVEQRTNERAAAKLKDKQ